MEVLFSKKKLSLKLVLSVLLTVIGDIIILKL